MANDVIELPRGQDGSRWRARALIDITALHNNIDLIREIAPDSKLMAVIKADAYGHGLDIVCEAIHERVDAFAVATLSEGVQCREIQDLVPVVVLSELWQPSQLETFSRFNLDPVIHNEDQVSWFSKYTGRPLDVWIKFDSGMNRLGIDPGRVEAVCASLKNCNCVKQVRLMSHLANADDRSDGYTLEQLELFKNTVAKLNLEKSFANSAGVLGWPDTHFEWNRPGLILYGVGPFVTEHGAKEVAGSRLQPVMQLQARLIAAKQVAADQPVGYGGVFRTRRKTRIGLVGLGYGDGYPRLVDSRSKILVNGKLAPIIGRISMDMITVDLTDLDGVKCGDTVTLWGPGLPVEEVADWAGTIPYELLCKVTPRIPRVPIQGDKIG